MPSDKTMQARVAIQDRESMVDSGIRGRPSLSQRQKDALDEARDILQEPSRNTKRKILISINLLVGAVFIFHVAFQLATAGHLPDPGRDNILMPTLIVVMTVSAVYNITQLVGQREGSLWWNRATAWGTVIMIQIVCLSIVHRNPNTATSLLIDQTMSMITIFLTGLILNRRAALVWFAITVASLAIGVKLRGTDFEYHLMTHAEVAQLKALHAGNPAAFTARLQTVIGRRSSRCRSCSTRSCR